MNAIVARYDRDAADYERYWAPVLQGTTLRLLDYVADYAGWVIRRTGRLRIAEVGVGTGSLVTAALERWPLATVVATDAAAGMLDVARARVDARDARVTFATAAADELPLVDASVDLVLSTFVLQLVPDRIVALREAARVLVPRGRVAYVTWLDRDSREPFVAAEQFDEAVYDLDVDEPEGAEEPHAGDVHSARSATNELRRAGFVNPSAREELLEYQWTLDTYLEYKLRYDERALIARLSEGQRAELERLARLRLAPLRPEDFRWRAPVVFAHADRPDDAS